MFGSFESHYFTFQFVDDIVVARCIVPRLTDEQNIEALGQELLLLIGKYECRRLILNLADVEYMTSSMIGKLIRVHRQLHRDGGQLVLAHLHPTVKDILNTSHLLTYFHSAKTVEDAVLLFEETQESRDEPEDGEDFHLKDTVEFDEEGEVG